NPLRRVSGQLDQLCTRYLACQQHHAVVADDSEAGLGFQVGVRLGDIDRGAGFDQLVVNAAAQGAGAIVALHRRVPRRGQDAAAAGQSECEQDDSDTGHSSLPNSWRSIRSHRQWMASRWTPWMRAVERAGTRISTSSGSSSEVIAPPSRPVRATTCISLSWAACIACRTLAELPLVEIASSTSPGCPSARICLENTSS